MVLIGFNRRRSCLLLPPPPPPSPAALALLDDGTPVRALQPFFTTVLRQREAERRAGGVVTSLQASANLQTRVRLLTARARAVKITRNDVCGVCGKRLGAAAFALRHDGSVGKSKRYFVHACVSFCVINLLPHVLCSRPRSKFIICVSVPLNKRANKYKPIFLMSQFFQRTSALPGLTRQFQCDDDPELTVGVSE